MSIRIRRVLKAVLCLVVLLTGVFLTSCRSYAIPYEVKRVPLTEGEQAAGDRPEGNTSESLVQIYYLDPENQRVVADAYPIQVFLNQETISSIFNILRMQPSKEGLVPAVDRDTALLQFNLKNNIIHIDVSQSFYQSEDPVAARVALVNTFTGLEGIDYVQITVEGQELMYPEADVPIGTMERYTDDLAEVRDQDYKKLQEAGRVVERELYFRDISGQYMLAEMRTIYLEDERPLPVLLTEALTLGPVGSKGLYPSLPGDVQVLDCQMDGDTATLYMSRSFIHTQAAAGQPELSDLSIRIASLVLTVTALSDVTNVKFFYEDGAGGYTDQTVAGIRFYTPMRAEDFADRIGRRIVVYFASPQGDTLVPEYRAVRRDNRSIEKSVLEELLTGPKQGNAAVIPSQIREDITVKIEPNNTSVVVDLPPGYDGTALDSTRQRMFIYSIVNSLTDPINLPTVNQVRFTIGGNMVDSFGSVDISRPLERNPSLIQQ